ncbi:uncharacterized protein LOC5515011 [Nematostella vectensis]|uniref:uncharacterized protein LOC5515011 n=1 Tax=Nematostella vectensis TaxID=45351 RepID=UPI0020776795|nr:uncharacterized protein LOC5515011 [Nematostella vectensis]
MKSLLFLLGLCFIHAQAFPQTHRPRPRDYWIGEQPENDDNLMEELMDAMSHSETDVTYDESKRGLPPGAILHKCSDRKRYPFGCCPDMETKAVREDKFDCGPKLCIDIYVSWCSDNEKILDCQDKHKLMCAKTCKNCPNKAPAAPLEKCRAMADKLPYGCCWNGVPATGPNGRGCLPCVDLNPNSCRQFKDVSGGCNSGSWGIRSFMQKRCAKTCGICDYSYEK